MDLPIRILYEDGDVCVIEKPGGMVVNDSRTSSVGTVQEWFRPKLAIGSLQLAGDEFIHKGGVVHRLDKDTSGVMVLAKNAQAYQTLKQQFLERKTKKEYVAVVEGVFSEKSGIISAPIDRHPVVKTKFAISDNLSRTAVTEWEVVRECWMGNTKCTVVIVRPLTGRTHQIRVHMKHIGHPVVGDRIYGHAGKRLMLHASMLGFAHPSNKEWVSFVSPVPLEFNV